MKLNLPPFQALIKTRCGLLFEGSGEEKLMQALRERIAALGVQPTEYHTKLLASEAEFQALVTLLTINETYFFREPEQINLLVERLAPRFLAARTGQGPVRILSAGCSSGEEPYSLVMALTEKHGAKTSQLFEFVGGDIDHTVLTKARVGCYSEFSFRGVPSILKQRYFDTIQSGNYRNNQIKLQIKSQVHFVELNLLAENFAAVLHNFDIIFFRNVSIYFDSPTRKIIQQKLASLLKPDGILVIGTAETLANDLGVLALIEEDGLFYFTKGQPNALQMGSNIGSNIPRLLVNPPVSTANTTSFNALTSPFTATQYSPPVLETPLPLPLPLPVASYAQPKTILTALTQARQFAQDRRLDEALLQCEAVLNIEPENTEALLLKSHILINRRDFSAAYILAERVLAADAWSVDALLLLGLSTKWQNQATDAIRWFKQAAYARNECWPAHYYLADLYRTSGDIVLARRTYRVVLQLLSGTGLDDIGIRYIPLGLPAAEVRFLCEHQLAKLPTVAARTEAK